MQGIFKQKTKATLEKASDISDEKIERNMELAEQAIKYLKKSKTWNAAINIDCFSVYPLETDFLWNMDYEELYALRKDERIAMLRWHIHCLDKLLSY